MSLPEPDPFDYEACLSACARGDLHALKRLYEHESGRLLGVVKRIVRDHALAEDIVHGDPQHAPTVEVATTGSKDGEES